MPLTTNAQAIITLYPGSIPNSRHGNLLPIANPSPGMVNRVLTPELEMYIPEKDKATGAAVIVCPGGSYKVLTYEAEGVRTAKELMKNGIAAFVLKYRLPDDSTMIDKKIGPLQDAQQAIKVLRENASKWGIDTARVGIMGFSAGGHLAATVATHFKKAYIDNQQHTNLRPAFLIVVYPVISMEDGITHKDSRTNLLGEKPSKETIDLFSNELQAGLDSPPTYITHAGDDQLVDVDNSILFYEKLRHSNVPAELHLYPKGGHGFVLRENPANWMVPLFSWMKKTKII
ncbi:alpha/beta hydrolase [Mucilaginibacter polytrichastri]|uniref:alpha/beta hydrolase n=1 Tax=Mucilaginibacter polytrichastri TaxID=1302689 RepID=UPI001FE3A572|nr:alpha/beta hydrolase [Mucilaginibacter polytrichastri]